jgi:hypothetical protein
VYPPPRRKEEYAKHPKDVSDTRKADLREPWIENEGNGFGAEAQRGTGLDPHIVSVHGVRDFDSVPCKGKDFGPNELFTTVFTGGVKLRAEEKEARRAEAEEWRSKVVVDNLTVRSHIPTKKPSQQDKIKGIRRGAAKTVALRGGKNGPIKTFPVSISMQEECVHIRVRGCLHILLAVHFSCPCARLLTVLSPHFLSSARPVCAYLTAHQIRGPC